LDEFLRIFKTTTQAQYDPNTRRWYFPRKYEKEFEQRVGHIATRNDYDIPPHKKQKIENKENIDYTTIRIRRQGNSIYVKTIPYNADIIEYLKSLPGRLYIPDTKEWSYDKYTEDTIKSNYENHSKIRFDIV
jgi:hypothetical protein